MTTTTGATTDDDDNDAWLTSFAISNNSKFFDEFIQAKFLQIWPHTTVPWPTLPSLSLSWILYSPIPFLPLVCLPRPKPFSFKLLQNLGFLTLANPPTTRWILDPLLLLLFLPLVCLPDRLMNWHEHRALNSSTHFQELPPISPRMRGSRVESGGGGLGSPGSKGLTPFAQKNCQI